MRLLIAIGAVLLLGTGWCRPATAAAGKSSVISYRFEVLVYSCQVRILEVEDGQGTVVGIIPAMTPKSDARVMFDTETPVAAIRINPPWKPTPTMRKDPDDRVLRPARGGQAGNPLGRLALYLSSPYKKMKFVRIHEAPEMPQRELVMDESGNQKGFRESRGCVGLHIHDLAGLAARLSGRGPDEIEKMIEANKTRSLPLKHRATVVYLRE